MCVCVLHRASYPYIWTPTTEVQCRVTLTVDILFTKWLPSFLFSWPSVFRLLYTVAHALVCLASVVSEAAERTVIVVLEVICL